MRTQNDTERILLTIVKLTYRGAEIKLGMSRGALYGVVEKNRARYDELVQQFQRGKRTANPSEPSHSDREASTQHGSVRNSIELVVASSHQDDQALRTLDAGEQRELKRCEAVIRKGLRMFIEVGQALMTIRDRKLHHGRGYRNFDDYCREYWGYTKAHANRQIGAARVACLLGKDAEEDVRESQLRHLTPLEPDVVSKVWEKAKSVAAAHNGKITAALVREAIQETIGSRSESKSKGSASGQKSARAALEAAFGAIKEAEAAIQGRDMSSAMVALQKVRAILDGIKK